MTFWAEYHGGFKGFSSNEYFEWEDSHPLYSNALSPSGSVMITITITDHHKSRLVETMTFWAEYHGGF
jgi:4-hydroxyphenylpyruvate dioxygenase-like putative hemolysin